MFTALSKPGDTLKASYSDKLKKAFIAAVTAHVLLFVYFPPFEFRPYTLDIPEPPIVVRDIPNPIIPPPPAEIDPPKIVVPIESDEADESVIIPPTDPGDWSKVPIPTRTYESRKPFMVFHAPPEPVLMIRPEYPRLAREAGIEGTVLVKVVVSIEGRVVEASLVASDVTPDMEKAALKAARACRFEPAKQGSEPVEAAVVIPFEFRLE